jgi:hypothetical protein
MTGGNTLFTEAEISWIIAGQAVETSTGRRTLTNDIMDLRQMGCPSIIFQHILEDRVVRKIGVRRFQEFRNRQNGNQTTQPVFEPLVSGETKLF